MRIATFTFAAMTLLFSMVATADVELQPGEYVVFYHHDVLGSPVTATNEQGQVIWHERTQSYGKSEGRVSQNGNPFGDNALPAGNSRQGYTGHTLDNSAGLTYMKARYYDHNIGRFLSNDPVGFTTDNPMMFNRYAYANSNPYSYFDPSGEYAQAAGGVAIAAGLTLTAVETYNVFKEEGATEAAKQLVTGAILSAVGGKLAYSAAKYINKFRNTPDGIVYKRTDPRTGECYIGQCKSQARYDERQHEHDRDLNADHEYEIVDRAEPSVDLDVAEETMIRIEGGLQREGGSLVNKRHQMSEERYRENGGTVDDPNR